MSVRLRRVHFHRPSRPLIPILEGLSIHVQSGQFCALIGPSGAGKSIVLSLIELFYSLTRGRIELDGEEVRTTDFRAEVAFVPQDSVLFGKLDLCSASSP